jgi:hypothetical protein
MLHMHDSLLALACLHILQEEEEGGYTARQLTKWAALS